MYHYTPLIGTLVAGLVAAFLMGAAAQRLRISPVAGYLIAGLIVGPYTPGFVADAEIAAELAELGVILLMFGVGLHFSLRDLLSVKRVAVPGAVVQMGTATLLGMGLAWALGWTMSAGFVFGLSLSVASTVVLLRALQVRGLIHTQQGRIAVGWLIVEDLAMVLALVLLPAIARTMVSDADNLALLLTPLAIAALKVVGFIAFMLIVGRRVIPVALHWVAHTGSRELFRLAVLAIALGIAFGAAALFDVSFALGAFFAGMILGESRLSQRAAEETLPLRDAFAVLFFVSVGMLFNPAVVMAQPWVLLATLLIIVVGKSIAAYWLVRAFGHSRGTALTVSASLAQIGEFSFILLGLGVSLGMLHGEARDMVLAAAILSILIHPFLFNWVDRQRKALEEDAPAPAPAPDIAAAIPPPAPVEEPPVILVGYGRVGRLVGAGFKATGRPFVLIEEQPELSDRAEADGARVVIGDAGDASVLEAAGLAPGARLLIAIPEGFETGRIAAVAKAACPDCTIIARAHSDAEVAHIERFGAAHVIMGEREIAARMLDLTARPALAPAPA